MNNIVLKLKCFVKTRISERKYKKYKKYCRKNGKKEFIVFNTPIHGNLGDHAIFIAEKQLLEQNNIECFEVPTYYEKYYFDYIKKNIDKNAIISITGGGFIGSQWLVEENLVNKVINEFYNHIIIIFPQTIYFKDDEQGQKELEQSKNIFDRANNLIIFTREEKTYNFAKSVYTKNKIYLVPDIVLNLKYNITEKNREGILLCLRKDAEGIFSGKDKEKICNMIGKFSPKIEITDTVEEHFISANDREKKIKNKLRKFAKSKLIITDRLHGMIFATITNTPCVVFSNYNYKVKGVYNKWIKPVDQNIIFKENLENLELDIDNILKRDCSYNEKKEYNFKLLEDVLEGVNIKNEKYNKC